MVREEGTCTFNRKTLTLDLFADDKSAAFMFHNGASYVSGYLVGTNNWGITVDDASTAKILLGGLKLKLF